MIAFLREVSPNLSRCELTHLPRTPIDLETARRQHAAFGEILRELGVIVEMARPLPDQPDGVFIEDAAVLLPEVAIIARPGAVSRLPEAESIIPPVAKHRPIQRITTPATLDGGDVLRIGRTLFVGASKRTNAEGVDDLKAIVDPFGYEVRTVEVRDCLHLKSAATHVPPNFLVANPAWVDVSLFGNLVVIPVDEKEPGAANTLTLDHTTLVSASFPKTDARLRTAGIKTRAVDISEFEKAEGGLTCLALFVEARGAKRGTTEPFLKVVQAENVPPVGDHTSQAIVHGGFVFVAPQHPAPPTSRAKKASVEEQAAQVMQNIATILSAAGSSLLGVVRATVFLSDAKQWERVEPIYARAFDGHRPVCTVVENPGLPRGVLVSIEVVAAVVESPSAGPR